MMRTTTLAVVIACSMLVACDFGSDDDNHGGGAAVDAPSSSVVCGDGVCAASEVGSCMQDCGGSTGPVCGNNACDTGETSASCPNDCGGGPSDGGTAGACPADPIECLVCLLGSGCPSGLDQAACTQCITDGLGGGGGGGGGLPFDLDGGLPGGGGGGGFGSCTGGFPDGSCDANENSTTCPLDCQ